MSHSGYFVTTLILVTSGLLSIGSSVENKLCFNVSIQHICYFQPQEAQANIWNKWDMARNICQINRATLPIIEKQEIQKTFEHYHNNIGLNTREIWLGGRQEVTKQEWQWSNKKPFNQPDLIYDGDQNQKTQAVIRRSSNLESPSNSTLRYLAWYPSSPDYYICQYSASRCPTDNSAIQNGHHGCLKVFNNRKLNALQATKDCNNSGGHLAIFDGDEFLTKAPNVYQQMHQYSSPYYSYYFIGLQRTDTKSWLWMRSNNEKSIMEGNYDNWDDGNNHADGNCLFATANDHKWKAGNCFDGKGFICQTIEILSTTTTTTREGTESQPPNMNDQQLSVYLIGAIAGTAVLIIAAFIIIIVLLRRHRRKRKADVAKSPKMSASYVKPKVSETSDYSSPAVYEEIQLKTTEEEDKEATVYAEITAPQSDRNQNHSQQGGDTCSIVYAAVEFTNNYN